MKGGDGGEGNEGGKERKDGGAGGRKNVYCFQVDQLEKKYFSWLVSV